MQPVGELAPADAAGSEIQNDAFLIINRGIDFGTVENEKRLHGGVPHALVAIDERMTLDQREAQCGCLFNQRGIQVDTTEGGPGLGDRRLERA